MTDRIGFGVRLNSSFVIHYRFRSIIDIHGDRFFFTSEDRYCLWIRAVPLCLQFRQRMGCAHARHTTLCFGTGFQNIRNQEKYGIITEYRCIAMRNSTRFILVKPSQQRLLHVIPYNCSEMLGRCTIIAYFRCEPAGQTVVYYDTIFTSLRIQCYR